MLWVTYVASLIVFIAIVHWESGKTVILDGSATSQDQAILIAFFGSSIIGIISFYFIALAAAFSVKVKSRIKRWWDITFFILFTLMLPIFFYVIVYMGVLNFI